MSSATSPEDDEILQAVRKGLPIYRWELRRVVTASELYGCDTPADTLARLNEAHPRASPCELAGFARLANFYMAPATKRKTSFPFGLLFAAHDLRGERLIRTHEDRDSELLADIEKQTERLWSSLQKISAPMAARLWGEAIDPNGESDVVRAFERTLVSLERAAKTVAGRHRVPHRPPVWLANPKLFSDLLDIACAWNDAKWSRSYAISEKADSVFRMIAAAFLGTDPGRPTVRLIREMMAVPPHSHVAPTFARAAEHLFPVEAAQDGAEAGTREGISSDDEGQSVNVPDAPDGVSADTSAIEGCKFPNK